MGHIVPMKHHPSLALDPANVRPVCPPHGQAAWTKPGQVPPPHLEVVVTNEVYRRHQMGMQRMGAPA